MKCSFAKSHSHINGFRSTEKYYSNSKQRFEALVTPQTAMYSFVSMTLLSSCRHIVIVVELFSLFYSSMLLTSDLCVLKTSTHEVKCWAKICLVCVRVVMSQTHCAKCFHFIPHLFHIKRWYGIYYMLYVNGHRSMGISYVMYFLVHGLFVPLSL